MTPTIAFATLIAAVAGFLSAVAPENWVPFYRAELAQRGKRRDTAIALFAGRIGQAVGTGLVGLLVTVFVIGVIGVAEASMQFWAGIVVLLLSLIYFARAWRQRRMGIEWEPLEALVESVSGSVKGRRTDPYGKSEETVGAIMRHAIGAPGFVIAPMFIASTTSGLPNVGNAFPAVVAFVVFTAFGTWWTARRVVGADLSPGYRRLVERRNEFLAVSILVLGIVTLLFGSM